MDATDYPPAAPPGPPHEPGPAGRSLAGRGGPRPEDVELVGLDVGALRAQAAEGGATDRVVVTLTRTPTRDWARHFATAWDHLTDAPPEHRPGIARVVDRTLVLDGTSVREVHLETLRRVVAAANDRAAADEVAMGSVAAVPPAAGPASAPGPGPATGQPVPAGAAHPRAVILTAIPAEYAAVRRLLRDPVEETHPKGTVYEVGTVATGTAGWRVAIAEIGAGNEAAALEAERAAEYFGATHLLFVGIAGGLKDVVLGDVVAATKIYGYESGKDRNTMFMPRPEVGQSSYDLIQRARAVARGGAWAPEAAGPAAQVPPPKAYVAPIAAGSKVVAGRRSQTARFLREQYGDALAVEMEGSGLLRAAHARPDLRALVVRGISDLVDNKADSDKAGWQEVAARHAAAFAAAVLTGLAQ